ncbi:glycoside hydrolase family 16 protein [Hypoxylon sp. FL1150]|nr:glycoside hydrolase family 16 protein [Hypoxylon sp. FL1150]
MVASPLSLRATVLATVFVLVPQPASAAANCQCYLSNGSQPQYFANHQFLDFRNIANPQTPDPIDDEATALAAGVAHPYFSSSPFADTWSVQAWTATGGSYDNTYSKNDVYIAANADEAPQSATYVSLRTVRHDTYQESAEIQTVSASYQYVSMRMYARTRGDPGAVTAMFTYRGGATDADVQEADLEILTSDDAADDQAHYTNQPSIANGVSRAGATSQVTIPAWTEWRTHRYDWSRGTSTWYVDGVQVNQNTYQAPVDPATLLFNVWSDGGSWSGNMAVGGSAAMDVQWIEILYNNTDFPTQYAQCDDVCSIDDSTSLGVPVLVSSGS